MYDLIIIGGGINGTGIARDAAGRGMRVYLAEQGDLAQATSSASTKLIHGGLRYLEYYDFKLVREALQERERLLNIAPHIIWPLRFVLPHENAVRPAWLIRFGLFLYDNLARRKKLPGSKSISFPAAPYGNALRPDIARGFLYSDAWVEDSRLVILNAMDAADRGATIATRTKVTGATRQDGVWQVNVENKSGIKETISARALINAAGPWAGGMLQRSLGITSGKNLRLVKGSHIIVPRLFDGEHAYILQNPDRRIVFAIPYEYNYTLIGTTDVPMTEIENPPQISQEETDYLCASVNAYFTRQITPQDVVWSYSGIRPLFDDAASSASAVTRDFVLDIDKPADEAPLLSVFGGKITTFRVLAEQALAKLTPQIENAPPAWQKPWTETAPLPGGDIENADINTLINELRNKAPFLSQHQALRLARAYGTRVWRLLGLAKTFADLGEDLGAGLTAAEIDYLIAEEWAQTADDILWRRSKLGLHMTPAQRAAATAFIDTKMMRFHNQK